MWCGEVWLYVRCIVCSDLCLLCILFIQYSITIVFVIILGILRQVSPQCVLLDHNFEFSHT